MNRRGAVRQANVRQAAGERGTDEPATDRRAPARQANARQANARQANARQHTARRADRLRDRPATAALVAALGIALLASLPAGPQSAGAAPTGGPDGLSPAGSSPGSPSRAGATTDAAGTGAAPAAGAPGPSGAVPATLPTAATGGPPAGAAPERVRIPDIGVDAPLETLRLQPDGSLAAPRAWGDAGWYADGTRPGDAGPAVIAGHVDSTRGPAVFFRLGDLRIGALIEVERAGQWLSFRAVSVAEYPKNGFPSAKVYGPTPDPQLRLITCGGGFDRRRGSYRDNIVVFAVGA